MFPSLYKSAPDLFHFLCSQSAVVSAPHGRWAEELSRETKRTEEERQVGCERGGGGGCRNEMKKGYCLGAGEMQWHRAGTKGTPFIREESKDEKQTYEMDGDHRHVGRKMTLMCVCVAHLRHVWSEETEVYFCCFVPLRTLHLGSEQLGLEVAPV